VAVEKTREESIRLSLKDYIDSGEIRTETIEYRGVSRSIEVVRLNPSIPLLNHDNSRIVAQLKVHPQREIVLKDPISSESQNIIASILKSTEKFSDLKSELTELGQKQPGIITRQGVLVNGNTRLVAIREAGIDGFDVGVLPEDTTSEDCFDIEMSLQVRKLTHQDYTFTNRLLLIERYLERGHSNDELIKRMGWKRNAKKELDLHLGILSLIEEIRSVNEPPLDYAFFDDKEQMLKDLYKSYQQLNAEMPFEAQEMKWLRIMGMVLGVNKDQVRAIDEDFLSDSLLKRIDGNEAGEFLSKFETVRGQDTLDEILGAVDDDQSKVDVRAAVGDILKSAVDQAGNLDESKLEDFHELKKQMRTSADFIIDEEKQRQLRSQPNERLSEARMRIEEIADRLPELFRDPSFERGKFEFETKKALKAIQLLNEELQRQLKLDS
jgi:hypothetical protein